MASVGIRQLQRDTSAVVDRVARTGRPTFVTNRGKPVAAVVPVDLEAFEDFVMANAPTFVRSMRLADRDLASGRVRPAADVFAELGVAPTPSQRRNEAVHGLAPSLTDRERQILLLLIEGRTNSAIAESLGIAPKTVKAHLGRIMAKLGVTESRRALKQGRSAG
jgi:prevent-host-death family protein